MSSTPVSKPIHALRAVPDEESDNAVVIAILLTIVTIGYGAFLTTATWRRPLEVRVASAPARAAVSSTPAAAQAIPVVHTVLPTSVIDREPVMAGRGAGTLSARSLTVMWKQRDTRSLEQAFSGLRSQTLALHRCATRMTGDDRAVARCEGAGRSTYTIDFRRSAGRWLIDGVSTR